METLLYQNKQYVPINGAAELINVKPPLIYYYIKKKRLDTIIISGMTIVSVDSIMQLNHYLRFRYSKNNQLSNDI
jgi:hypothetical protein